MALDVGLIETIAPLLAPELRPLMPRIEKAAATLKMVADLLAPHEADIADAIDTLQRVNAILNPPVAGASPKKEG